MNTPKKSAKQLREMLIDERPDGSRRLKNQEQFAELTESGKLGIGDFSIRDLAEAFLGTSWESGYNRASLPSGDVDLRESGTPVSSSVFPQIAGQLLLSTVRKQFDVEASVFSPLVETIESQIKGTEVVPSVTNIAPGDAQLVQEAQEYPTVGVSEETFRLPAKEKKGFIIELTKEAIHFDKTNLLVQQAQKIGAALGAVKENSIIDCLVGATNNYVRNGVASNTYLTAGVINNQSSLPLTDWTDIDAALRLWEDLLDPNTSEPLAGYPKHLVVTPAKLRTARRIVTATQTRSDENQALGTRSEVTIGGNPVSDLGLTVLSSIRLYRRILAGPEPVAATARDGWFLGDIGEAVCWLSCFPLTVMQQSPDSPAAFSRDVAMRFKSSMLGVAAVKEKRRILRLENAAW